MEQAATSEGLACSATVSPAMGYMKEVQNRFGTNRPEVYQQFLSLLHDYAKEPDLNKVGDIHRQIQELFVGEPDLIEGFEKFLPESVAKIGRGGEVSNETEEGARSKGTHLGNLGKVGDSKKD